MTHRLRAAVAAALFVAVLGIAPSAVLAGGPQTHVVDDDGKGSAANCNANRMTFDEIQVAIDFAAAGDTILVCPGTYREGLDIENKNRLKLRSVVRHGAIVRTPLDNDSLLNIVDANRTQIRGFRFTHDADGDCFQTGVAVRVSDSAEVVIHDNRIAAVGPNSLRSCLMLFGAHLGASIPTEVTSVTFTDNLVRDFLNVGISVEGAGATALVQGNTVDYRHAMATGSEPGCCESYGIAFVNDGAGQAYDNLVQTSLGVGDLDDPTLDYGIATFGGEALGDIRRNDIRRADVGIGIDTNRVMAVRNTVTGPTEGGIDGILVSLFDTSVTGVLVSRNTVSGYSAGTGIHLNDEANENIVRLNRAVDNALDCLDEGTDNTWTDNTGATADPPGICTE